jgi:hypothetical protein
VTMPACLALVGQQGQPGGQLNDIVLVQPGEGRGDRALSVPTGKFL